MNKSAAKPIRHICAMCAIILSFCLQAFAADKADDVFQYKKSIAEGAKFLKEGQSERALARFKHAKKILPEKAESHFWIAMTYSQLENYALAANNAEKATIIDKKMANAWTLWGQSLVRNHQYDKAREKLEQAFLLDSSNYIIPFNLGLCYYFSLDKESSKTTALDYFKKTLELNPKYSPARLMEGCCYLEADLKFLAIISFKNVIKTAPNNAEAYFRLGLAYRKDGRAGEAERAFLQVLRLKRNHKETHLQLGHLYYTDLLDKKNARLHFKKFLDTPPFEHPWKEAVEKVLNIKKEKTGEVTPPRRMPDTPIPSITN